MFVLDKYSDRRKGQTRFFFKLQFPDAGAGNYEVNIEDVFSVVNH